MSGYSEFDFGYIKFELYLGYPDWDPRRQLATSIGLREKGHIIERLEQQLWESPWEPQIDSVVSLVSCQCPARLSDSENEEPSRGKMIQTHRSAFVSKSSSYSLAFLAG